MSDNQLTLVVFGLLCSYNIYLMVTKRFYYREMDDRMKNHELNVRYHLNEVKRVDYKYINNLIGLTSVFICVICCVITLYVSTNIGLIAYVASTILANIITIRIIAKKYNCRRDGKSIFNKNGGKK